MSREALTLVRLTQLVVRDHSPIKQSASHKHAAVLSHMRRSNTLENRSVPGSLYLPGFAYAVIGNKKDRRRFEAVIDAIESSGVRAD